jgi:two-component system chemotaxis response regulator CheY
MFSSETKFLIVDDFKVMRTFIRNSLNTLGFYNVIDASDGKQAVLAIETSLNEGKPFDFIISDWNMPNMDGHELLQQVRSNKKTKDLPFLMISAEADRDKLAEVAKSGASDYIVKPFTMNDFTKSLVTIYTRKVFKQAS